MAFASLNSCCIATTPNSFQLTHKNFPQNNIKQLFSSLLSSPACLAVSFIQSSERGGVSHSDSQSKRGVDKSYPATENCHLPLLHDSQVAASSPQATAWSQRMTYNGLNGLNRVNDEAQRSRTFDVRLRLLVLSQAGVNHKSERFWNPNIVPLRMKLIPGYSKGTICPICALYASLVEVCMLIIRCL